MISETKVPLKIVSIPGLPFEGTTAGDVAYAKMYLKSTIRSKKTVLDYTWFSMVAEIGGYTGLLLGVSVNNIASLVDKIRMKYYNS